MRKASSQDFRLHPDFPCASCGSETHCPAGSVQHSEFMRNTLRKARCNKTRQTFCGVLKQLLSFTQEDPNGRNPRLRLLISAACRVLCDDESEPGSSLQ
mmetsp:Transcript_11502/g.24359  ORF Transcript_11502/g.24359 Transcript_11502/m.24359 type:complete len:99 (+) Transcript_11502:964-1260(+)